MQKYLIFTVKKAINQFRIKFKPYSNEKVKDNQFIL